MRNFLIRMKFIDHLTTHLQMSKTAFVERLSAITDRGTTDMFSDVSDIFSSSPNEFKGQVFSDGFVLKRKKRLFTTNANLAVATGILKENHGELTIETEINGFHNFFFFFYGFLLVFYTIFIVAAGFNFFDSNSDHKVVFFIIPFILLHAGLMFSLPYIIMRRSVKKLKYELEREFFYLTKDH